MVIVIDRTIEDWNVYEPCILCYKDIYVNLDINKPYIGLSYDKPLPQETLDNIDLENLIKFEKICRERNETTKS